MKLLNVCLIWLSAIALTIHASQVQISVQDQVVSVSDQQYLSYNFGTDWIKSMSWLSKSASVRTLLNKFGPTHIRVGGTFGDFTVYNVGSHPVSSCTTHQCYVVNASQLHAMFTFAKEFNHQIIFGLNDMYGRPEKTTAEPDLCVNEVCPTWDSTNAQSLIQWIHDEKLPVFAFELGNELNKVLRGSPGAKAQASDFHTLRNIVDSVYADDVANKPKLFGPDAHSWTMFIKPDDPKKPDQWESMLWYKEFLNSACDALDAVTYHMYIGRFTNTDIRNFTDPAFYEREGFGAGKIIDAVREKCPRLLKQIWVGETASANSGGIQEVSDRYVDIFWFVDQLGLLAKLGHAGFMRQKLVGGTTRYGMIDAENHGHGNVTVTPRPDFWAGLLFKNLMGSKVLNVDVQGDDHVRVYGHCATSTTGMVSLAIINLRNSSQTITVDGIQGSRNEWHLTMAESGLSGFDIKLNGEKLIYNGVNLPDLSAKLCSIPTIEIEPLSVTFVQGRSSLRSCSASAVL